MSEKGKAQPPGKRSYRSPRRAEQAAATRREVLSAARELFITNGYSATTIADIAARARVSLDTIYATAGRNLPCCANSSRPPSPAPTRPSPPSSATT